MTYKVLVADDDADNREIAAQILEVKGYNVVLATNGDEALNMITTEKPDVVMMDLSMPKFSGWDAIKRLKADPELKSIPIIAFTAHAMSGDREKVMTAGFDDYITKPCTPTEIAAIVAKHLKK